VPQQHNKLFPKVIQFFVTADEPGETRKLLKFIDENPDDIPAMIFDADANRKTIFYVPFRAGIAPPEKVLISSYNVPADKEGLTAEINNFMKRNLNGVIMFRKSPTLDIKLALETEKWLVYFYGKNSDE
jgi:hypothetical protein